MATVRPPIRSVLLFAACPECQRILRARLDFRRAAPVTTVACPWCYRLVTLDLAGQRGSE